MLWNGIALMLESQTAGLSQKITEQTNGIVLVFSEYKDGAVANSQKSCFFVPKQEITFQGQGLGHVFTIVNPFSNTVMSKYLYLYDNKIIGNDLNKESYNGQYVLEVVFGV